MQIGKIVQLTATPAVPRIQLSGAGITHSAVKGEDGTGYEDGKNGIFACSNCVHYKSGYCDQPIMRQRSKLPKNANGDVKVDAAGCCEYVNRKSKT